MMIYVLLRKSFFYTYDVVCAVNKDFALMAYVLLTVFFLFMMLYVLLTNHFLCTYDVICAVLLNGMFCFLLLD